MSRYWLSWWTAPALGSFELHSPWWFSGFRGDDGARSVCAAVVADSEEAAREKILAAYDTRPPAGLEFRFVDHQPEGWSPFNGRFRRRDWMQWED